MAQTDTDQEGESVRGGRNSRLKKLLVLIPLAVSIFLGIRLHMITGESEDVLARTGITADMEMDRAPDAAVEADRPAGTSPYTVSGVDESRRKAVDRGLEAAEAEDENIRKVYLTFDDGPSSNTGRILDILAEYDVKATFFVVGKEEEEYAGDALLQP